MDRKLSSGSSRIHCLLVLSAALLCDGFLPGCGRSDSGEFTDYSQLAGDANSADAVATANDQAVEDESRTDPAVSATVVKTAANTTTIEEPQLDSGTPALKNPEADTSGAPGTPAHVPSGDPNLSAPRRAGYGTAVKSGEPLPIKLLVPDKQFRKEEGITRATFDDIDLLKILNMQPVPTDAPKHFPGWLSSLDGVRVRIRGFMRPSFMDEDLTEFLFVRDNGECCFGPNVAIYDLIAVTLAEGETTDYIQGIPFDVEGTFRIKPYADELELLALYFLDDAVILK